MALACLLRSTRPSAPSRPRSPTTPLFFNGLTRPDENAQPSPDLAESWTISDDNLTYTFKLRQGVTFHDGQPFSAQDVKFTWQTICHPENQPARQLAGFFRRVKGVPEYLEGKATEIAGVTIVDDHTIKVELSEIYAPFLSISAGQFIIPQHIWKDVPATELGSHEAARIPVGTGPFVVESGPPTSRSWPTPSRTTTRVAQARQADRARLHS